MLVENTRDQGQFSSPNTHPSTASFFVSFWSYLEGKVNFLCVIVFSCCYFGECVVMKVKRWSLSGYAWIMSQQLLWINLIKCINFTWPYGQLVHATTGQWITAMMLKKNKRKTAVKRTKRFVWNYERFCFIIIYFLNDASDFDNTDVHFQIELFSLHIVKIFVRKKGFQCSDSVEIWHI